MLQTEALKQHQQVQKLSGLTTLPELSLSGLFPSQLYNLPPPLIKPAGLSSPSSPSHLGLPFPWSNGSGTA